MNLLTVFLQAQGGGDFSFLIMMLVIYGKIKELEDNAVIVEIASGVKIKVDRNSIYADAQAQANK